MLAESPEVRGNYETGKRFKCLLKLNGDLPRDRPILILIAALAIFCPPTSLSARSPRPYVNGIATKT